MFYLDTEFIENDEGVTLLSLAIVSTTGNALYWHMPEIMISELEIPEWHQKHTIPYLTHDPFNKDTEHKTLWLACHPTKVHRWIEEFMEKELKLLNVDSSLYGVFFFTYFGAYDWYLFCRLFGGMLKLPGNWVNRGIESFAELHAALKCMGTDEKNVRVGLSGAFIVHKEATRQYVQDVIYESKSDDFPWDGEDASFSEIHHALIDAHHLRHWYFLITDTNEENH